jgi:GTP-binding protein
VIGRVRKSGKPFFLAVNKVDHRKHEQELFEFAVVGVENIYPISAEHGDGVADLLDDLVSDLPMADVPEALGSTIRVAVVGRPNVGKSSLINKLLRSTRCIVSDIPGTTRDAIDTSLEFNGKNFLLVDTAGIRRKGRTKQVLDKFSVIMALKALDRCDIAVILVDGSEGITDQDATIAGYAYERGRGCVIAVNKWDLTKAREITIEDIERQVKDKFKFLDFAPVMVLSAKTGRGVDKLLPQVELICAEYARSIPTGRLNECLERAVAKNPISSHRGKFVKIFYSVQIKNRPPTFKCFINYPQGIHFSYERYLVNSLREMFGFSGTPVRLVFSGKSERV